MSVDALLSFAGGRGKSRIVSIRAILTNGTLAGLTNDVEDVAVAMRYSTKFIVTEDGRCDCLFRLGHRPGVDVAYESS